MEKEKTKQDSKSTVARAGELLREASAGRNAEVRAVNQNRQDGRRESRRLGKKKRKKKKEKAEFTFLRSVRSATSTAACFIFRCGIEPSATAGTS